MENAVTQETEAERKKRQEVYQAGVRARRDGFSLNDNPYKVSSWHYNWRKGWEAGAGR